MDIRGKKLVVIGGAGLIGSHTVDELTKRGRPRNLDLRQLCARYT